MYLSLLLRASVYHPQTRNMVLQASDDESPSRASLEESLTLNKKQSWFGSIRSVVHRGALSAKAAVESLRGSHGNKYIPSLRWQQSDSTVADKVHSPSVAEPAKSNVSHNRGHMPNEQSGRDGTSTSKSAAASLRQTLSRHSRHSGRGSVSNIFRRSGSNASSLRSPRDPASFVRNSQDMSRTMSPLARDENTNKDSATLVPLPSSPINIPPPAPTLRLDLGPPAMLSPFNMTSSDLAELKVLQDPTNITTGMPPSCPLNWQDRAVPVQLRRGAFVAGGDLPSVEANQSFVEPRHYGVSGLSTSDNDITSGPQTSALASVGPPHFAELHSSLEQHHQHPSGSSDPATRLANCDDPFQDPICTAMLSQVPVVVTDERSSQTRQQSTESETTPAPTARILSAASATNSHTPNTVPSSCQHDVDNPVGASSLPSLSLATKTPPTQCTSHATEHANRVEPIASSADTRKASADTEVTRAQQKYRDSLAGLEESSTLERLEPGILRHVEQNPFVEGSGIPGPALKRSDSLVSTSHSEPLANGYGFLEIPDKATSTSEAVKSHYHEQRKDSLLSETVHERVHEHGPPSPERSVRLPLRPKPTTIKHTSFESTIFKPILDRVAAKNLGVFRPGSDPSLRQKYFPRVIIGANSPVESPRQSSLDSEKSTTETRSCDAIGIFERTVEKPSPLHIHKQFNTTPLHTVSPSQTPVGSTTPGSPGSLGSSPTRTPSMGDRQQFDLQRAERHARYSAIFPDECNISLDDGSNLQLAEFGNAGLGSQCSTPKRSSGGTGSGKCDTPSSVDSEMGKAALVTPGWRDFTTLSKD
jgi:hypothetical protein